jgi:hypothetical protein
LLLSQIFDPAIFGDTLSGTITLVPSLTGSFNNLILLNDRKPAVFNKVVFYFTLVAYFAHLVAAHSFLTQKQFQTWDRVGDYFTVAA